ncbi:hypothetical protein PO909_008660 [Leuciscus waleckii]
MKSWFYSPYFIVPKKGGGLRQILDLQVLNQAFHKLLFKMLMQKRILTFVRHQDWFAAINLKDTYYHVSVLLNRPFLWFAYKNKVLPASLPKSRRLPLPRSGKWVFVFSTISTNVSFYLTLEICCADTETWCSGTSAIWGFESTGRRPSSPLCRASLSCYQCQLCCVFTCVSCLPVSAVLCSYLCQLCCVVTCVSCLPVSAVLCVYLCQLCCRCLERKESAELESTRVTEGLP